ncbi:unnamed protein product, partial [Allacma fusca]
MRTSSTNYGPL